MNESATFHQSCYLFFVKSFAAACSEKPLTMLLCENAEQNMHLPTAITFCLVA